MNLFIASDHAGFELKESLKALAPNLGITLTDLGTHSKESVDYPDYAHSLCKALIQAGAETYLGILICGSGVGVSIAANRHPEIRAVLAETSEIAALGREHNHANVLCLGARFLDATKAAAIVKAFIEAKPDLGERHLRRVIKLRGTLS
jgi:ribose 5-phosphate isomerase B